MLIRSLIRRRLRIVVIKGSVVRVAPCWINLDDFFEAEESVVLGVPRPVNVGSSNIIPADGSYYCHNSLVYLDGRTRAQ